MREPSRVTAQKGNHQMNTNRTPPTASLTPLAEFLAKSGLDPLAYLKLYLRREAPAVANVGGVLLVLADEADDWLSHYSKQAVSVRGENLAEAARIKGASA